MPTLSPADADDVAAVVRDARAAGQTLELVAGGSRRALGRPVVADSVLDLSRLAGVVDYDPSELVLTAGPATPLAEIRELLEARGQHLAFEPPDMAPLWGGQAGAGTLGGTLLCGLGGPRRPATGAPRDHFLGFAGVNGLGEQFSAGGKVIKNVTGYDLPKLMAGAFGTLAVLTEVTVKVLPAPIDELTLIVPGLSVDRALAAMAEATGSSAAVSAAAYLADGSATIGDRPLTAIRIDGVPVSLAVRAAHLSEILGPWDRLDAIRSKVFWHDVAAVHPFARDGEQVWRVSLPPSSAAAFVAGVPADARVLLDWSGALAWLFLPPASDGHAAAIRSALAAATGGDGHASLVRADAAIRASAPAMQPLEARLAALSARVKDRFDPDRVLNPGRMYEGV